MNITPAHTISSNPGVWTPEAREAAKQRKAFQDFETMFAHMMLKQMRTTLNESSSIEKSHATTMYEEMMGYVEQYRSEQATIAASEIITEAQ